MANGPWAGFKPASKNSLYNLYQASSRLNVVPHFAALPDIVSVSLHVSVISWKMGFTATNNYEEKGDQILIP